MSLTVLLSWAAALVLASGIDHLSKTLAPMALTDS